MFRTDDPIADFHRYDVEQCEKLSKRPKCEYCGEHIQDDFYYYVDGIVCGECLDENHKRYIED
jgi:formylmethanofuran dehydrogenase subunit E